jgi:hypothetical protein
VIAWIRRINPDPFEQDNLQSIQTIILGAGSPESIGTTVARFPDDESG